MAATLVLGISATAHAKKPVVAVFEIQDRTGKLKLAERKQLTDYLTSKIAEGGVFLVVPGSQIKKEIAKQKKKSYKNCFDQQCQIEIGRELAAGKSLSTQLVKLGSKCVVISTLYDLRRATTESSASQQSGCTVDQLVAALVKVAGKIKGQYSVSGARPATAAGGKKGGLFIKSRPRGASVWVDGKEQRGKTPLAVSNLVPGQHFIELRKGDYRHATKVSVVALKYREVSVTLKKVRGTLEVLSNPPEATILLDGTSMGKTPRILPNVEAGEHVLTLKKQGYLTARRKVHVGAATKRRTINVALKLAAVVAVRSTPVGASVFLDGKRAGRSPGELKVAPGTYTIRMTSDGYLPAQEQVAAKGGAVEVVNLKLQPTEATRQKILAREQAARKDRVENAEVAKKTQQLARLRRSSGEEAAKSAPVSPTFADRPADGSHRTKTIWGYTLLGVGLACAAGAGVLYGVAVSQGNAAHERYTESTDTSMPSDWDALYDDRKEVKSARTQLNIGHALAGVALASVGVSLYMLLTRPSEKRAASRRPVVSVSSGPGGAALVVTGEF